MRKAILSIIMCGLAAGASAQGTAGTVEFTPTVGYWFGDVIARGATSAFTFDVTVDDAPQYGFRLAYRFTDNWALEGMLSRGRADLVTGRKELFGGQNKLGTIDITSGELGFEVGFGRSRLVPFMAGGIGAMRLEPNLQGMSSDTRFSANFGAGFKLFFSPQIALRFDWRGHSVHVGDRQDNCDWWERCDRNDEWTTFKEVAMGLSFVF